MECLMQYLDDLEDFIYAVVLAAGRIIRAAGALLGLVMSIATPVGIVLLGLARPPLGLAAATMLSVVMLYRAVVNRPGPGLVRHAASPERRLQPR